MGRLYNGLPFCYTTRMAAAPARIRVRRRAIAKRHNNPSTIRMRATYLYELAIACDLAARISTATGDMPLVRQALVDQRERVSRLKYNLIRRLGYNIREWKRISQEAHTRLGIEHDAVPRRLELKPAAIE